jgi:hypothetical protein
VLKQLIAGSAAVVAGMVPLSGVASAESGPPVRHYDGGNEQVGLVNIADLEILHNVNLTAGLCDNNIGVFIVQAPIQGVLNGIGVPVGSPGSSSGIGFAPENCAMGGLLDGGTVQGN